MNNDGYERIAREIRKVNFTLGCIFGTLIVLVMAVAAI